MGRCIMAAWLAMLACLCAYAVEPPRRQWTIDDSTVMAVPEEELKALGVPRRDIPPEENAAWPLLEAAEIWEGLPQELWELSHTQEGMLSNEERAKLEAFFQRQTVALTLLEEAFSRPHCQLPVLRRPGKRTVLLMDIRLPYLALFRSVARKYAWKARLAREAEDTRAALESGLSAIRLGKSLQGNGSIILDLVAFACKRIGEGALLEVVLAHSVDENNLEWLASELDFLAAEQATWRETFLFAKAVSRQYVDYVSTLNPLQDPHKPPQPNRLFRILIPNRTMKAEMDATYDRFASLAEEPLPKAAKVARESADSRTLQGISEWNLLGEMLLRGLDHVVLHYVWSSASLDATRVAVGLRRYHLAEGWPPESLDALSPRFMETVPPDPFTGEPFIYRASDDGWLMYSVGRDLVDDGGDDQKDIVVRWPPQ